MGRGEGGLVAYSDMFDMFVRVVKKKINVKSNQNFLLLFFLRERDKYLMCLLQIVKELPQECLLNL